MMRGLLLCCLVALATSQTSRFELGLSQDLVYRYKYEGRVDFGLARTNRLESGVRIKCELKISGVEKQTYVLHVSNVTFEEFNGIPETDKHQVSDKITKHLIKQLKEPIVFDYYGGHVCNIQVSEGVSDTITNIARGMLSCFHSTFKPNQRIYELKEVTIHGNCPTKYIIEDYTKGTALKVTQEVDINDCSEKAELYSGMATAVLDKVSKQKGESVATTMTNTYIINKTDHGGLITSVTSRELQYFSSFNVKGGTFRMKAEKKLVLLNTTPKKEPFKKKSMNDKGDITHKIVEANVYLPIVMQDRNDPYNKALKLIEDLADANKYSLNKTTTENSIKVYQLLRLITYEDLGKMWKKLKDKEEQRRWFLDLVAEVNDVRIVNFLKDRYKSEDISVTEAVQVHMLAISHLNASFELVEQAKAFFNLSFCNKNQYMWQTVMLTYGSLVYRYCAYNTPCPVSAIEPLHTEAEKSRKSSNETKMIGTLKALGNAGHPKSIKEIVKFLPNVGANTLGITPSVSVMIAAVQSLRLLAAREPDEVQKITFKVFTQKSLDARVRMNAFLMLFEARPPLSLVIRVSSLLLAEEDENIGTTAYFYLKRLARSSTPDNHYLSTACSIAVKMLMPVYGRHSNGFRHALRLDWFNDNFLIGTAAEAFMLRSAADAAPSEVRMRTKFFFIGRILELLELGVQVEEIKELFSSTGKDTDFNALFKKILNWEDTPNDKPVFSFYTRFSGQELFFLDIRTSWIRSIIQYLWPGKDTTLEVIRILQKSHSLKYAKTFMVAEARYFQATSLGLQAEIAKYYLSTNALRVNANSTVNPPLEEDLGNLLSSDVSLKTEGSLGLIKDIWLYFGINTELFQVGNELRSKVVLSLPWNIDASLNFKEKKFEINLPSLKDDFEVVCISSDVYAINRNIYDPKKESSLIPRFKEPRMMTEMSPVLEANYMNWKLTECAESQTYGIGLCAISDIQRRYYHEEYPLYYLMGFTHMAIKAVTVEPVQPIKKIRFEYSSKIKKDPPSTRQLLKTLRSFSEEVNDPSPSEPVYGSSNAPTATDPVASVDFKVLALNDGSGPVGYQGDIYENSLLIVSRVGKNASKIICVNYAESTWNDAKANISFGHECEPYSLSMRAVATPQPGFLPPRSIKTFLNWGMIPESMAKWGRRIGRYMPGIAVLSGFSETPANNTEKEVVATVTVASADSIEVELKLPKHTMCHRAIPFPMPPGNTTRNMSLDDL